MASTALLVAATGCASAPLGEPPTERQLWSEHGCFAHALPEWRHEMLRALGGKVYAAHDGPEGYGIPEAEVLIRPWPHGAAQRLTTGADGTFLATDAKRGEFEVAICMPGWNPWRGFVHVSNKASRTTGGFPLELGQ